MKYAVIAHRFENDATNRLLEHLNNREIKTLKITLAAEGTIISTYPQSKKVNYYDLIDLAELLTEFNFDSSMCVIYDLLNPPLLINNQEQWSTIQPSPIGLYNLQIKLVQEVIRSKCSKYVRVGCLSEKIMQQYLTKDWVHSEFSQYDSLESVYRIASRDMTKLLTYIGKVDFLNTRLSAVVDLDTHNRESIADWLQEYECNHKKQIAIDAISAKNLAAILVDLGFYGKNKTDTYIGSNSFYSIRQAIKFLTDNQHREISCDELKAANLAASDLIQTSSAFAN